jgi:Na+-driven multidrug efflux pump
MVLLCGALVSTGFSSLVRAEGRLRFSTMLWVVPVLVQITLDPLLILGLGWGVRGAALGTVGGQAVSAGMSFWFFFRQRDRPYRITRADLRPHGPTVRALIGVGAPSFLTAFGATMIAVLVNNTLSHVGGATTLAAYAVCARIQTFVMMPQPGISQGLQPIVGYNAGRGLYHRVRRARTFSLSATVIYGVLAAVAVIVGAGPLVALFLPDGAAATTTQHALRIIAIGFIAAGVTPLISAYSQSLGRPALSYAISIGTLVAVKGPLVIALAHTGETGVWTALALGEILSALAATLLLRRLRLGRPHRGVPATTERQST